MFQQVIDFYLANNETIVTFLLGLNVFMCALNTKWNWPVGLVAVVAYGLNAWLLYGLYADAVLQIFYFVTGIYGWWYWCRGGDKGSSAKITDLDLPSWALCLSVLVSGTFAIGHYLEVTTDSTVPYLDSYTTVICLIAQVLLMLKVRSAWLFWIAANVVYVYLFHIKGLSALSTLYVAFIFNAILGYANWSSVKRKEERLK